MLFKWKSSFFICYWSWIELNWADVDSFKRKVLIPFSYILRCFSFLHRSAFEEMVKNDKTSLKKKTAKWRFFAWKTWKYQCRKSLLMNIKKFCTILTDLSHYYFPEILTKKEVKSALKVIYVFIKEKKTSF